MDIYVIGLRLNTENRLGKMKQKINVKFFVLLFTLF